MFVPKRHTLEILSTMSDLNLFKLTDLIAILGTRKPA
jgi:hypothetical protein